MTQFKRDPREANLPKWAQKLLDDERHKALAAVRKLNEHIEQQVEPTAVWYGDWQNPVFLPDRYGYQKVHFQMNGTDPHLTTHDDIQVGIKHGFPNTLEVIGGARIVIAPTASNVVEVQLIDR